MRCVRALLDRHSLNSTGRIGRTSISTCVDQGFLPRTPSSRDLSRCFPIATFWRVTCSLAELPADTRNCFSKCLTSPSPCLPMIPTASVHLRLHGVETHSQFSSRAFPFHGLLCRQARSVQLCFSRTHLNDSLVFAPTAMQMLNITNASNCHTLSVARVSCPITVRFAQ